MNDPHVVALIYRVEHDASVSYKQAVPLNYDGDAFKVRVNDDEARFEMKQHFETAEAAQEAVEQFIRKWEFSAMLERGPGAFGLLFKNAEIEDRDSTQGHMYVSAAATLVLEGLTASFVAGQSHYPSPPEGIEVTPEIKSMIERYARYREGKDTLAGVAYFCLTVLKHSAGGGPAYATKFNLAGTVLDKIGRLTANKGGTESRKGSGLACEFTPAERRWLDGALKLLIRRAAEVAHDPAQNRSQITMADLPNIADRAGLP